MYSAQESFSEEVTSGMTGMRKVVVVAVREATGPTNVQSTEPRFFLPLVPFPSMRSMQPLH